MTFNYCKIYKRVKFRRWDAGDDRWATTAAGVNNRFGEERGDDVWSVRSKKAVKIHS